MRAKNKPDPSLLVQAKDCYNPEDYLLVHKDRYADIVKYQQWWKDACDVTEKVRGDRAIAETHLQTLREFINQALPFITLSSEHMLPHLKEAMGDHLASTSKGVTP